MGEKSDKTPVYKKWWFWMVIVLVLAGIGGASMSNKGGDNTNNNSQNSQTQTASNNTTKNDKDVKPGENFAFDGLTLNVSPDYSFTVIDNQFSEQNGQPVVALPITVTNDSSEAKSLNMYSYKCYGTQGVELENPSAYFQAEASDFAGNLQPGASYTKNLYFMYDGNGTYKIEFGLIKTEKSLSIDINK